MSADHDEAWRDQVPDEVEYEPTSVKELLVEMKDVSELMVDLAYSAVAFDNEDIAEEVRHLERRMDDLNYRVRLTALLAGRSVEDAEMLGGILHIAAAAERLSNAAADIARLLGEVETRPFLPRLLERAEEKIRQYTLPDASPLADCTLTDLNLETETGMRIIALRRGLRWIFGPTGRTRLAAGDSLVLRGTDEGYDEVRRMAEGMTGVPT